MLAMVALYTLGGTSAIAPGVRYDFDKNKDFLGIRPTSGFPSREPTKGPLQVQELKSDLGRIFGDIFLFSLFRFESN
jgi:hypothetical protein